MLFQNQVTLGVPRRWKVELSKESNTENEEHAMTCSARVEELAVVIPALLRLVSNGILKGETYFITAFCLNYN